MKSTSLNDIAILPAEDSHSIRRVAWGILIVSFMLYCVICSGVSAGIYVFFFESSVPMSVAMRVGRGTVEITGPDLIRRAERETRDLTALNSSIRTDALSQTTLAFTTPNPQGELVASVTIKGDTSVNFRGAYAPRFEWGRAYFNIDLRNLSGELDVQVFGASSRRFLLEITTPQEVVIHLTQNGRYAIQANESVVKVGVREGSAALFSPDAQNNRLITAGQQGILSLDTQQVVVSQAELDLVQNGLFALFDTRPEDTNGSLRLPARWGCRDEQDSTPRGSFRIETFDGRSALRLMRGDGAQSHGETGCRQPFTEEGVDVSGYGYLEFVTTFYINYQSLSKCGVAGSECPLMLLIDYEDINGVSRKWRQGFYYADNPQNDFPLRCDTCTEEHQRINEKVWYTFESGNLMTLPLDIRPARINGIELYASGHEYDVFVSEVALLVNGGSSAKLQTGG